MSTILRVKNLEKKLGGIQAIADVSFHVKKGEILSIIGPNGAGKTTIFNCISGFYKPSKGKLFLMGRI